MKLKSLNVVLSLLALAATVGIALILQTENSSTLFWVNTAICVVLELLLINAVIITASKEQYTIQNIATAKQIVWFAILAFIWLIVYNLALTQNIEIKWYYIGYIVLLVIYTSIVLFTHKGGKVQIEVNQDIAQKVAHKREQNIDLHMIKSEVTQNIAKCNVEADHKHKVTSALELLCEKLRLSAVVHHAGHSDVESRKAIMLEEIRQTSHRLSDHEALTELHTAIIATIQYVDLSKK